MANKKKLPHPPGGELMCSDDQLAVVTVINGEIFAACHDRPNKLRRLQLGADAPPVQNWVLSIVKQEKRQDQQILTSSDLEILNTRRYEFVDPSRGAIARVTFSLPMLRR